MIWHNDWIWHNLDERLKDRTSNFKFGIFPYTFKFMKFDEASRSTAKNIYDKYKKIYVALSGGMDSLYVTKVFHECNIPFTAVIVDSESNKQETKYAFDYCSHNEVKTFVIHKTEKELIKYYVKNIYSKVFSVGVNITGSVLAGNYAKENDGILVTGDYLIDVNNDTITCSDYDYYKDVLLGKNINFFSYDPAIAYAMTKEATVPFHSSKYKLYGFEENRDKIYYHYSKPIKKFILSVSKTIPKERYDFTLMSRDDFLVEMEKYGV